MLLKREDLDTAINDRPVESRLVVTPLLRPAQIGEASVDLRLGPEFLLLRKTRKPGLDPTSLTQAELDEMQERVVIPYGDSIWLHPGHFVLAATLEFLRIPADLGAYVLGRSSWGRVGLIVATAIMVHPGFTGCLTLELINDGDSPICLHPGARIAQLAVHTLDGPTADPYGPEGKYQAPIAPEASRLAKEHREIGQFMDVGNILHLRVSRPPAP
jgi:dCTP deaminase